MARIIRITSCVFLLCVTGMAIAEPQYAPDRTADILHITIDVTPIDPNPAVSTMETQTYIVRKGDTLSQLALDFDTTTASLVQMNNLANPDRLYVGQELTVPAGRRRSSAGSGSSTTTSTPIQKGGTYTIQKGDTLSEISLYLR